MKKLIAFLGVLAMLLTMVSGISFAEGDTIKIGTIYAMSGGNAAIGENILRGINFAVDEINAKGGVNGKMLEIVQGDHAGDPQTGKSEAERLINQEHVDVIMGCHMSVVTDVVAQVCTINQVPMITAISTLDMLSNADHEAYEYFFRLCPLNSVYVRDMLQYLKDASEQTGEEIKKIAIFTDRAAIGQELIRCVELFKDEFGFDLVATVDYSSNATDLSAQVLALKQADPDAILCDSYIGDATLFVQTLTAQNYIPKMIVAKANGFTDPAFITNLGAAANGVASVVEFNPDLIKLRATLWFGFSRPHWKQPERRTELLCVMLSLLWKSMASSPAAGRSSFLTTRSSLKTTNLPVNPIIVIIPLLLWQSLRCRMVNGRPFGRSASPTLRSFIPLL